MFPYFIFSQSITDVSSFMNANFIIEFIFEASSFNCMVDNLLKHSWLLKHHISNVRVKSILSVWIGHHKDEPADDHSQINGRRVIFPDERQANTALSVNVRVVYLIETFEFGRADGVIIRKCKLKDH
jgi:hypothetical protein